MRILLTVASILYIAVPTLAGLFSFWLDSKKDGFAQEKVFDLIIFGFFGGGALSAVAAFIVSRSLYLIPENLDPYAFIFGFIAAVSLIVLKWKWSLYRLLDNLAMALTLALAFWFLVQNLQVGIKPLYLSAGILLLVSNYILQRYRQTVIKSGLTFCLITGIFCLTAAAASPKTPHLLFLALLFTLNISVLVSRLRILYGKSKVNHNTPRGS